LKTEDLLSRFKEKAGMVSAVVHEVSGMEDALKETVALCLVAEPLENLMPGNQSTENKKILAAPNLDPQDFEILQQLCAQEGISLVRENVRSYPGGIDMGVTIMDFGIAETGTLVLNSDSEETRLATMLCETHVAILDKSKIRETALGMSDDLAGMTGHASSYTAFITGASRTADIERVLALGVHGPLTLHIFLTGKD
jgi:L-lactate dehydrogenase complex protein LldG